MYKNIKNKSFKYLMRLKIKKKEFFVFKKKELSTRNDLEN